MNRRMVSPLIAALMLTTGGVRVDAQTHVATREKEVNETRAFDELLARRVTLNLEATSRKRAIDAAAATAGVLVQYRARLLEAYVDPVTVHLTNVPLRVALTRILEGTALHVVPDGVGRVTIVENDVGAKQNDQVVAGRVTDASTKRPVVGATITLDGTNISTRTSEDGTYRLTAVPSGTHRLVVRRLGYTVERKSISVDDNQMTPIDIVLSTTATALEDVVTTVTGPQRRVELGNVVGVIKADSLVKEAPITSLSQLLTARVPGLVVSQGQGTVGGNVKLQIRTLSSKQLSTEPIVIVDGIRYSSRAMGMDNGRESVSPLNDLNPNDIERVEVVKGPSAATLYGTDASDGVILITTKRGQAGPARWSVFATRMSDEIPRRSMQLSKVYHGWGTWDGGYKGEFCRLTYVVEGWCTMDSVTTTKGLLDSDDWSTLKPSQSWTSGASVSGGQQSLRYFFSGRYDDQTGAVGLPDTVRRVLRAVWGAKKLPDSFLRPNTQTLLNLRSNVTASAGSRIELTVSAGYTKGDTRSIDPSFMPYTNGVRYPAYTDGVIYDALSGSFSRTSSELNDRFVGSLNGQGRFASWLTTRAALGIDLATRNRREVTPRDSNFYVNELGSVYDGRTRQQATSAEAGATATMQFGHASLRTSIGGQYVRTLNDNVNTTGVNLPPGTSSLRFAATTRSGVSYLETVTLGNYVEETLGLYERIFLTGAVRIDGAGGFGANYDAAVYPKFSASWLASQEPWLPKVPGLDELRVRAALGVSGRQALPDMREPGFLLSNPSNRQPYLVVAGLGNSGLRPERGRELETGLDAGILNQRLQLGLTWYRRRTTDQIITQQMAPGIGDAYRNVGLTTGHGFEAQLTARLLETRPLSLSLTLLQTQQGTKLVRLGDASPSRWPNGGYAEGYPLGARFIRPFLGYNDVNGDGIIVSSEIQIGDTAVYVGQINPTRTQTWTLNVGLLDQRIRLSALLDHQAGATILNDFLQTCFACREAYDKTAPLAQQALYVAGYDTDYRVPMSGNFTRLREITASMTVPVRFARMLRVQSSSVSVSARNLGLWTKYNGPDPESSPMSPTAVSSFAPTGIPLSRTWTLRCDIGL